MISLALKLTTVPVVSLQQLLGVGSLVLSSASQNSFAWSHRCSYEVFTVCLFVDDKYLQPKLLVRARVSSPLLL